MACRSAYNLSVRATPTIAYWQWRNFYSTGFLREDNWDWGGWAWKNNRTAESAPAKSANRDPNEIVAELAPQPQDIIVYKQKPSVFFGSNLMSYLTLLGSDSLIVTGCTTSGCVRATVIDVFSYITSAYFACMSERLSA
jgi:nicotinamidase-related amidase